MQNHNSIFHPRRCSVNFQARSFSHLAFVLVLALAPASIVAAQGTVPSGSFGFVLNATFSNPSTQGGAAILGLMNFDGAGNATGPYTLELGSVGDGQPRTITGNFTGTYSSNSDGTGTVSIVLDNGLNLTLAMVIDNRGHSLQLAVTNCSGSTICDPTGAVVSGVGEAEFNGPVHPIHERFLNGSYGLQGTKSSPAPSTEVGVWSFDGAGNVSISDTFVGAVDGSVQSGTESGTYSVNCDGTGTITTESGKTWVFVITNDHSGLLVLQTNRPGNGVLYGIGQQQWPSLAKKF